MRRLWPWVLGGVALWLALPRRASAAATHAAASSPELPAPAVDPDGLSGAAYVAALDALSAAYLPTLAAGWPVARLARMVNELGDQEGLCRAAWSVVRAYLELAAPSPLPGRIANTQLGVSGLSRPRYSGPWPHWQLVDPARGVAAVLMELEGRSFSSAVDVRSVWKGAAVSDPGLFALGWNEWPDLAAALPAPSGELFPLAVFVSPEEAPS